jgi:hypothetical protein
MPQMQIVLSAEPEAMARPSGDHAAARSYNRISLISLSNSVVVTT